MSLFYAMFFIAFTIISIVVVVTIIRTFIRSNMKDTNGDGKIDANDFINGINIQFNNINQNNETEKPKTKKCPYCDSIVKDDVFVCPNCGANLGN
jgi:hypothetical protein